MEMNSTNSCLQFFIPSLYSNATNGENFVNSHEFFSQTTIEEEESFAESDDGFQRMSDGRSLSKSTISSDSTMWPNEHDKDEDVDDYTVADMENCLKNQKPQKKKRIISKLSRQRRNISERKRREKQDECINTLASLVPLIVESDKKLNKLDVLRLAASYLRLHKISSEQRFENNSRPKFFDSHQWDQLILEAIGGFVSVIDASGKVIYVSKEIKKILGYDLVDIFGQSIYSLVHPDDEDTFQSSINEMLHLDHTKAEGSCLSPYVFYCSMKIYSENCKFASSWEYELVKVVGCVQTVNTNHYSTSKVDLKQEKVLTLVIKPCANQRLSTLSAKTKSRRPTFSLKLDLDGRIRFIDSQFTVIFGHLFSEVVGDSIFNKLLDEDMPIAYMVHRQILYTKGISQLPYRITTVKFDKLYIMLTSTRITDPNGIEPDHFHSECAIVPNVEGERAFMALKHYLTPYVASKDFLKEQSQPNKRMTESSMVMKQIFGIPNGEVRRPRGRPRKQPYYGTNLSNASFVREEKLCEFGCDTSKTCKHVLIKEIELMSNISARNHDFDSS